MTKMHGTRHGCFAEHTLTVMNTCISLQPAFVISGSCPFCPFFLTRRTGSAEEGCLTVISMTHAAASTLLCLTDHTARPAQQYLMAFLLLSTVAS